ncbi:MAG: TIGR02206 family membrane protein [Phycisphaeraceae bacterium]|nr:TIGR02206 family membrane protein [Phycisphaeraceae bacterium]
MLSTFETNSPLHIATAGLLFVSMGVASVLGRRWKDTPRELLFRRVWAWSTIVWQIASVAFWAWPTHFDLAESLPLHLCDIAAWIAPLALLTQKRWLRAVLYFWAIGLSTQAFFTPVLAEGPAHPRFWFFWIGHTQIVGSAIYDVVALGFRPRAKDFVYGVLANAAFFAIVMPVNLIWGVNYGFVGNVTPIHPTLIDKLGPWPLRIVWIFLLVHTIMLALWLAWPLGETIRRRRSGGRADSSLN